MLIPARPPPVYVLRHGRRALGYHGTCIIDPRAPVSEGRLRHGLSSNVVPWKPSGAQDDGRSTIFVFRNRATVESVALWLTRRAARLGARAACRVTSAGPCAFELRVLRAAVEIEKLQQQHEAQNFIGDSSLGVEVLEMQEAKTVALLNGTALTAIHQVQVVDSDPVCGGLMLRGALVGFSSDIYAHGVSADVMRKHMEGLLALPSPPDSSSCSKDSKQDRAKRTKKPPPTCDQEGGGQRAQD